jgi:choline dehydrogenase-like flavoprotein
MMTSDGPFDVCIVGAGAAGLTIARELAGKHLRVALIEGGGLRGDPEAQALLRGESVGRPYFPLEQVRISGFGGTTTIWNGACRPLDAIDFAERSWVPHSGWPISREDLDPFYSRAQEVCELGPYAYAVEEWEGKTASTRRWPLDGSLDTHIFQLSRTRFGRAYRQVVLDAPNISTCLGWHAVEVETAPEGRAASGVRCRALDGREMRITARSIVLAAGGIENARLLLLSKAPAHPTGLGNQHDLVGHFFTEHLYMDSGELVFSEGWRTSDFYAIHHSRNGGLKPNTRIEAVLALSERRQREEGLLRTAFLFPPRWRTGTAYYSDGFTSLLHLIRLLRVGHRPYRWRQHAGNVLAGLPNVLVTAARRQWRGLEKNRAMVRAFAEQAPNDASRVLLAERRDRLGRNLARLDWRVTDRDLRSFRRAHEIFSQELARSGLGSFDAHLDPEDQRWPRRVTGGYHHMGTTRMAADPCQGVVDADARVHGTANVYVAGSSVFPTGGYANPTLTIVALSIRLADHLRDVLA